MEWVQIAFQVKIIALKWCQVFELTTIFIWLFKNANKHKKLQAINVKYLYYGVIKLPASSWEASLLKMISFTSTCDDISINVGSNQTSPKQESFL